MIKTEQKKWSESNGWVDLGEKIEETPQLVLAFGGREILKNPDHFNQIRNMYPHAHILSCSTAGEIIGSEVSDNSIALTAIYFEKTTISFSQVDIANISSTEAGKRLADELNKENLTHVLLFSDGNVVNGTELVQGITSKLPSTVSVTGGLAGDGALFEETVLGINSPSRSEQAIAIGLHGSNLEIGYGSLGGWDPFGPERIITRAEKNVLFSLDDKPALALYKEYLGDQAKDLPSSGLLFPLSLNLEGVEVVRTLLSVNEKEQSLTFAGNMPEGTQAQFMKANFERLIDGAENAANMTTKMISENSAQLALLISCVGRKLVLGARIEEEVDSVRETIGENIPVTGFYSYGEISPSSPTEKQCQLHNQTMTITVFKEN